MIKITVIALGKLKENYLREAVGEYSKRLSRYCKLDIAEINPVALPQEPSCGEIDAALQKEADMIKKRIPEGAVTVSLCVEGKRLTSEQFSSFIEKNTDSGTNMCFIIGSSYGIDSKIKQISDLKLSLSDMTFPHRLFRVMLLEQIYRGFKIAEGGKYHK